MDCYILREIKYLSQWQQSVFCPCCVSSTYHNNHLTKLEPTFRGAFGEDAGDGRHVELDVGLSAQDGVTSTALQCDRLPGSRQRVARLSPDDAEGPREVSVAHDRRDQLSTEGRLQQWTRQVVERVATWALKQTRDQLWVSNVVMYDWTEREVCCLERGKVKRQRVVRLILLASTLLRINSVLKLHGLFTNWTCWRRSIVPEWWQLQRRL